MDIFTHPSVDKKKRAIGQLLTVKRNGLEKWHHIYTLPRSLFVFCWELAFQAWVEQVTGWQKEEIWSPFLFRSIPSCFFMYVCVFVCDMLVACPDHDHCPRSPRTRLCSILVWTNERAYANCTLLLYFLSQRRFCLCLFFSTYQKSTRAEGVLPYASRVRHLSIPEKQRENAKRGPCTSRLSDPES